MQHQHPEGGGSVPPPSLDAYGAEEDHKLGDLGIAEAASPISSRPPASAAINFEEMLQATAAEAGGSSGNRWPRQETLALLQIRSEMDAAFRDATLKGPLWEQVSRKLGELGYSRSAKKCKEKFENVHKYYKRTKEGRGGRQDGKTYKFFTQLEALNFNTATTTATVTVTPVGSFPPPSAPTLSLPPPSANQSLFENIHLSLSSDSSSSSDDEQEMEMEMETETNPNKRKRKRGSSSSHGGDEKMMDFFEGLLKQVMQKQEGMQHKFLEAIEKREQDRMIREEAWKRQDLARLAREHDLMAQERAVSASRDAAIVSFLEKITGQTIHLPTAAPPPPAPPPPAPPQPLHQNVDKKIIDPPPFQAAPPEQRMMVPFGQHDLSSSRWPKTEVLALIQLRSGMDMKYQDVGPKGVLWEEISAGMQRLGYNRSAKRCKEKWENINKYFKKVKESNKKRPEDAKTCPYFHELDALYRKKALGSKGQTSAGGSETGAGAFSSAPFGGTGDDNTAGGENQPEDMLIRKQNEGGIMMDKCSNNSNSDNNYEDLVDENEEEIEYHDDDNDNDYDNKTEDEMKMLYKIQFSNGGGTGTGTPSSSTFITMVQ